MILFSFQQKLKHEIHWTQAEICWPLLAYPCPVFHRQYISVCEHICMYKYMYMFKKEARPIFLTVIPCCYFSQFSLARFSHMPPSPLSLLEKSVEVKQIRDHLSQLEIENCIGPDGKHWWVLKELANVIVKLCHLQKVKASLWREVLHDWKKAMLQPTSEKWRHSIQVTTGNFERLWSKSS